MIRAWSEAFESLDEDGLFELVCHPGCFDPAGRNIDRIHDKRFAELNLLTAPRFRELPSRYGIELTSYAELLSIQVGGNAEQPGPLIERVLPTDATDTIGTAIPLALGRRAARGGSNPTTTVDSSA